MLIFSQTTVALRCPSCGRLDFFALSRFSFKKGESVKIHCECGKCLLTIQHRDRRNYYVQSECIMCDAKHSYIYRSKELWNEKGLSLVCDNTGIDVGFIGSRETVMQSIKRADRSIRTFSDELGYDRYYINPEVMNQVLEMLRNLSEEGLMSCSCGEEQLEVEVYPDRVELYCTNCDAVGIILAETVKDLHSVRSLHRVQLETHAYHYLDERSPKNKHPVKK